MAFETRELVQLDQPVSKQTWTLSSDVLDFTPDDALHHLAAELVAESDVIESCPPKKKLSGATIDMLRRLKVVWVRYCQTMALRDPEGYACPLTVLRDGPAKKYMIFFAWYCMNYPARRLNSYDSKWRALRCLFFFEFDSVINPTISRHVNNYIRKELCEKFNLLEGTRPKRELGPVGLYSLLDYHWTLDREIFKHERERLQVATVLLFISYTSLRPGSLVESNCYRGTNQSLQYKDVRVFLLRADNENASVLVLELDAWLQKGKRHRAELTTFTMYEQPGNLILCPVTHFLGLAFADVAFRNEKLTPENIRTLQVPKDQGKLQIKFKDEVSEVPIFRRVEQTAFGPRISAERAMPYNTLHFAVGRLGQRGGCDFALHPYAIRRYVATTMDASGVSTAQLCLSLGHAGADTFRKHYQSRRVTVDVQSCFLGTRSRADLIKAASETYTRRHPDLPQRPPEEEKQQISRDSQLCDMREKRQQLKDLLTAKYGGLKRARQSSTCEDLIQKWDRYSRDIMKRSRTLKKKSHREALYTFHDNADVLEVDAQLNGRTTCKASTLEPTLETVDHQILERRRFAALVEEARNTEIEQAALGRIVTVAVRTLVQLCGRYECRLSKKPSVKLTISTPKPKLTLLPPKPTLLLPSTICLLCYGDRSRPIDQRTYPFACRFSLKRHLVSCHEPHFPTQPFTCPHELCGATLNGSFVQFQSHATRVHGATL
ncbi:MAG: hypothetical protein M1833_004279 [Piccolia ochrophora]|nr:MAG: hypothetical protein M1833_004279 [Piccolia ochrophora]